MLEFDFPFEKKSICIDCKHLKVFDSEEYGTEGECEMDAGDRNFGSLFGCCDFVRVKRDETD